jgi:hypothetical protein
MPILGKRSLNNLNSCIEDARLVADEAVKRIDFAVIEGHRGKLKQDAYYEQGFSEKKYPDGKHNTYPSLAFDFIPWPFDDTKEAWEDIPRFKAIADIFIEEAEKLGIVISCGVYWKDSWDADHIQFESKNGIPYPKTYESIDT